MEPLIVWTNTNFFDIGASWDFTLDLAYGTETSTNDYELTLPADVHLSAGSVCYVDGTEYGGIVDRRTSDTATADVITWRGRTWHGILANKVLRPNSGADYLVASGSVSGCLAEIISRCDLTSLMGVGDCPDVSVNYQYWRYTDAWQGMRAMLASVGLRPKFSVTHVGGTLRVLVGAVEYDLNSGDVDSDLVDMSATCVFRRTNHLVCLGSGELASRVVVDVYADANGNVSTTQTQFGADEVCEVYELSSTGDAGELLEDGKAKLKELQVQGEVSLTPSDESTLDVGDIVYAYDARVDLAATASIGQVIVRIERGVISITRETSTPEVPEKR